LRAKKLNFKENESFDKLRGGYYTPKPISDFLSKWIAQGNPQTVLEPSCGDGVFIQSMAETVNSKMSLTAIELIKEEAQKARAKITNTSQLTIDVQCNDFLKVAYQYLVEGVSFEASIGNPPYIRYQYLDNEDQKLSEQIFKFFNLKFTKHTNAWVPFVIACIGILAPKGRLAMVIPSELLHVLHANSLREFMLENCSKIVIIDPTELLFDDALQGTVLLMVEKKSSKADKSLGVSIISAPNNDFLNQNPSDIFNTAKFVSPSVLKGKWMKALLTDNELSVFEKARKLSSIKAFKDIAEVDVGIVTGANKFFLVDEKTVKEYELQEFARPMFGRSEHCKGIVYNQHVHILNSEKGLPNYFISFDKTEFYDLPVGAQRYIQKGEEENLHTRYKCSIRKPWYSVPSVYRTEIGMLKRSHNYPRLILNSAHAYTTDTAYRIQTKIDPKCLVYGFINSLTSLSAELEGRHYGGGVLELVPSEIERLLIPVIDITDADIEALDRKIVSKCAPDDLLIEQDSKVLIHAGLNAEECSVINRALKRIRERRQRLIA
jgi:adenine-specific DNA methylase